MPSLFKVHEVTTRALMDQVVELMWEGQYKPYMPHVAMYFPVDGYTEQAYTAAVAKSKDRMWKDFESLTSDARWICVIDEVTLKTVGCALWHKLDGSPAPDGCPKLDFYWIADEAVKKVSEEQFQQMMVPRCLWMKRRHGDLHHMVIHPDYRGKGVGALLMEWGNKFLDEEDLEGLIECNAVGRRLYEKWGYQTVMKVNMFIPDATETSPLWNKLAHDYKLPDDMGFILWRPPHGVVKQGERFKPWQ